jgi:hypothetical protein
VNGQPKQSWQHAMRDGRTRWSEIPPARRATSVMVALIQVGLLVAALADLRRRPAEQIRGSKRLWTFVVFINWVGPISYFLFGRVRPERTTAP